MEQDNRELTKEHLKLTKLANEAGDICKSFLVKIIKKTNNHYYF